jgi:hypothetical protein
MKQQFIFLSTVKYGSDARQPFWQAKIESVREPWPLSAVFG